MGIYHRVAERKKPHDPESSGKYYAPGNMELNELTSSVAIRSGYSRETVAGILYDLYDN